MQNDFTSGQCGQSFAPDGRPLAPDGLFLMDGIEGLRSLPRHSVDMLMTDPPPYGTTRNYWDVPLPLPELWEAVRWAVKPEGAVLLFATGPPGQCCSSRSAHMTKASARPTSPCSAMNGCGTRVDAPAFSTPAALR